MVLFNQSPVLGSIGRRLACNNDMLPMGFGGATSAALVCLSLVCLLSVRMIWKLTVERDSCDRGVVE